MDKKSRLLKRTGFLFLILLVGGLGGVLMDRVVLPFLVTLPILRNATILNPNALIVITRREEIRITDGVNQAEIINRVKNSIATVYIHRGDFGSPEFSLIGTLSGAVVTSDGIIATPVFEAAPGISATVVLPNKEAFQAVIIGVDSFTGVAFLKIAKDDLSVISQGFSRELQVSENLLAIWAAESAVAPQAIRLTLSAKSGAMPSLTQDYNFTALNTFLTTDRENWSANQLGAVVVNRDGSMVGFVTRFDQEFKVVRSEDLKMVIDNVLDDEKISWPTLTLAYKILGEEQTVLLNIPKKYGILLTAAVEPLNENDFIYEADGQTLTPEEGFQQILFKKKRGDKVKIKLLRNNQALEEEITL